jgi:hypothetical protein
MGLLSDTNSRRPLNGAVCNWQICQIIRLPLPQEHKPSSSMVRSRGLDASGVKDHGGHITAIAS